MLRTRTRASNDASRKLIGLYLQDHFAAAAAGRALATRTYQSNRDTSYGPDLRRLVAEIQEEVAVLRRLLGTAGVREPRVKVSLAMAAERLGRLKPNGRIISYSPLSRVLEFEGLIAGVQAKRRLWQSVVDADDLVAPREVDINGLAEQAENQSSMLVKLHTRAAQEAFGA